LETSNVIAFFAPIRLPIAEANDGSIYMRVAFLLRVIDVEMMMSRSAAVYCDLERQSSAALRAMVKESS
jgi:hypothetical protein